MESSGDGSLGDGQLRRWEFSRCEVYEMEGTGDGIFIDRNSRDGEFRRQGFTRWCVQEMGSSADGEFTRQGVDEMGSSADVKFTRWGVQEIGFSQMVIHKIRSSEDRVIRYGEFRRWGVYEMGSLADGKFTRSGVDEMGEFGRWGFHEMGSSRDEDCSRQRVQELSYKCNPCSLLRSKSTRHERCCEAASEWLVIIKSCAAKLLLEYLFAHRFHRIHCE